MNLINPDEIDRIKSVTMSQIFIYEHGYTHFNGDLNGLIWLHFQGEEINKTMYYQTCRDNYLDALQYINNLNIHPSDFRDNAGRCGQFECFKYVSQHIFNRVEYPPDAEICMWIAEGGHLENLRYAHENGYL